MDIKKELMKIFGSSYMFDYTETIINLLIEKDESNRNIIEDELIKMINKKDKEHEEELRKWNSVEYQKGYDLKGSSCISGQLSPSKDDMWYR